MDKQRLATKVHSIQSRRGSQSWRQSTPRLWSLLLIGLLALPLSLQAQLPPQRSELEQKIEALGLVDIQKIDPTIVVQLMYAGKDNFVGEDMYGPDLQHAYLQPHFAEKLRKAQAHIKARWGEQYSLIIYDAARPLSVQRKMWEKVRGTAQRAYVASPNNGGGRHNYGVAVDLSIINTATGEPVDMGSPVDHFGERAHIHKEADLVKRGLITPQARANRAFLIKVMKEVGLRPIRKEWWHFEEPTTIQSVRTGYPLLNF